MSSSASIRRRPRLRWPRQVLAFARKETAEVLRQPRLLLMMVVGPFAVMAAFGLGYRDQAPRLRTVFVVAPTSPLRDQVDRYADQMGTYVDYRGVVDDAPTADRMLADGKVDVLVEFPDDPVATVMQGHRAVVTVVHDRLDPIERSAISFVSALAIDRINGELLAQIVTQGQDLGQASNGIVQQAQQDVAALRQALDAADPDATTHAAAQLDSSAGAVAIATSLAGQVAGQFGEGSDAGSFARGVQDSLATIRTDLASGDTESASAALDQLDTALAEGSTTYQDVLAIDPHVLAQPLDREVRLAVPDADKVTDWYAPAAVILVLQQFGVAFGAMAFVRERRLGIDDVYRVAPVGAGASLSGKYLSYSFVGGTIGAALAALVIGALDVPVHGAIGDLAAVMALTLVASIGLGFLISLISRSDAQAVQYTMLVLLATLFFSGFFLSLTQLRAPMSWISYAIPAGTAMQALRDVMLRGTAPDPKAYVVLCTYTVVAACIAYLGVRHRLAPRAAKPA